MKKIIDGKLYDDATAKFICVRKNSDLITDYIDTSSNWRRGHYVYKDEYNGTTSLYVTKKGNYFLLHFWQTKKEVSELSDNCQRVVSAITTDHYDLEAINKKVAQEFCFKHADFETAKLHFKFEEA